MRDKPQLIERPEPSGGARTRSSRIRPRRRASEPPVQFASSQSSDVAPDAPADAARAFASPQNHAAAESPHRGRAFMAAGLACLLAAAGLAAYNAAQDNSAGQASIAAAAQVQAVITEQQNADDPAGTSSSNALDADEVVEIDGYSYLGVLRIPALGLELPVMADWSGDYEALKVAPTRQFGSVASGNLVIAGHNYTSHFGNLSHLVAGDEVTFTAVSGKVMRYEVESVETVAPESVDYVRSLDGLTLYTCTYGGQSRVLVHCRQAG